jgi:hypothetical protein
LSRTKRDRQSERAHGAPPTLDETSIALGLERALRLLSETGELQLSAGAKHRVERVQEIAALAVGLAGLPDRAAIRPGTRRRRPCRPRLRTAPRNRSARHRRPDRVLFAAIAAMVVLPVLAGLAARSF